MDTTTRSFAWPLNPGDYVIAEIQGPQMRILERTPNDLEAQRIISRYTDEGRKIHVLRSIGVP